VALAGGGKDWEQGTHKCEVNSGEGNGKPLLDSTSCLENPLLDLQESEQPRRATTTPIPTPYSLLPTHEGSLRLADDLPPL